MRIGLEEGEVLSQEELVARWIRREDMGVIL